MFRHFCYLRLYPRNRIEKIRRLKTLGEINQEEIETLENRFAQNIDCGVEFMNSDHHYSLDMDIFGKKSLFHYLNRTVTTMGRKCLARQLNKSSDVIEINARQQAVKELTDKLDFRQNLRFHGMTMEDTSKKLDALHRFFKEDFYILDKKTDHFYPLSTGRHLTPFRLNRLWPPVVRPSLHDSFPVGDQ